jgi:hypothetical protein
MKTFLFVILATLSAKANDIVYLHGKVQMADGAAPGRSVEIQLSCKGSDPVRLTNSGKNGSYYIKVERDEFNHVARSLPATAADFGSATTLSGPCVLRGMTQGYESSIVDFVNFTIEKDLRIPVITLTKK